jgi:uncharacterized Ntn-hydrolase superfamily protein
VAVARQVGVVDRAGRVAVHTGRGCVEHAGHVTGEGFCCQANMMRHAGVPEAMARAFVSSGAEFDERLIESLEAAEAAGGDVRGKQSAALVVVDAKRDAPMLGRLVDLRVDDNEDPLGELRRLNGLRRALGPDQDPERAAELGHGTAQGWFWRGVQLARSGEVVEARAALDRAYAVDEGWRELLTRLSRTGVVPNDSGLLDRLTKP